MKSVKTFSNEQEASIFALSLKELGIDSTIFKTDGGPYPSLNDIYGYSVSVKDEDYQNAISHIPIYSENPENTDLGIIKSESTTSEPVDNKWIMYVSLVIGIILGLFLNLIYSSLHYKLDSYTKYYYHNGVASKIVRDRNHDKKDDSWQIYHSDFNSTLKEDNNFDGKVDWWWEDKDFETGIVKIDCDSNEIPDLTYLFSNDVISKSFIHPNNVNNKVIYREYSSLGVLKIEFIDSDFSGGFDIRRNYDALGNQLKEDKIKDTLIDHF